MASGSRPVSPVGASKFERPYTLSQRTHAAQHGRLTTAPVLHSHYRNTSTSTWSTTDSSPVRDYSTAPSTAQQSPVDRRQTLLKDVEYWHDDLEQRDDGADWYDHMQRSEGVNESPEQDEWYAQENGYDIYDEEGYGDECPDQATLAAVENTPVFTADGHEIPFGSLYRRDTAINQRQLFIFIRHFYCGACQAYVKAITDGISLSEYFSIPIPTSIIVIGCGSPHLIPFYKAVTGTSYPVFAEPSRHLYRKLGMVLSGKLGRTRPEYMKEISNHDWLAGQVKTMREGLRARKSVRKISHMAHGFDLMQDRTSHRASSSTGGISAKPTIDTADEYSNTAIRRRPGTATAEDSIAQQFALALRKRDLIKGGNPFQIGGEFLFEDGEVIWCHRMRHYRDHVEVADIRRLLELDE